jgi:predicted NUDIX family phosphoesterase
MRKKDEIKQEYVLVFPTKILENIGNFQGFNSNTNKYLNTILKKENNLFKQRKYVENEPSFKQLIPYVVLKYKDTYLTYQRGKMQSEKRLFGNYSLGIGGHISVFDDNMFNSSYYEGLIREVNEELQINCKYTDKLIGMINDDSNDVGRVHFGIIHMFELENSNIKAKEKSINNISFMGKEMLLKHYDLFENWSKIFIKQLVT